MKLFYLLLLINIFISLILPVIDGRKRRRIARTIGKKKKPPARKSRSASKKAALRDPTSYEIVPDNRHSIDTSVNPFMYWIMGGSTVATNEKIRLTPAGRNRKGWIWNTHQITSNNWEISLEARIGSRTAYGGDGLGLFLLHKDLDPSHNRFDPSYLHGNIMGMHNKFKGIGVLIDTYDNDNTPDNPSIFVIENFKDEEKKFDSENDYKNTMYKEIANTESQHTHLAKKSNRAYRCSASVRNTGHPFKLLLKYIDNILHVYVKTNNMKKGGFKFCLSVEFDKNINLKNDYHIALSAVTGDVYDIHDIVSLETRYLDQDASVDDTLYLDDDNLSLSRSGTGSYGVLLSFLLILLVAITLYQYSIFHKMLKQRLDTIMICNAINTYVYPHYVLQIIITLLLFLCRFYIGFLLYLPVTFLHIKAMISQHVYYKAFILAKYSNNGNFSINSPASQLLLKSIFYSITLFYYYFII